MKYTKKGLICLITLTVLIITLSTITAAADNTQSTDDSNIHEETDYEKVTAQQTDTLKKATARTIKTENKNTYYISTKGNQTNNGLSKDTAWDLDSGFDKIKSYNNSRLIIGEGSYNINKTIAFDNDKSYYCEVIGEKKVQFNGQNRILYITGNSNIRIENITFSNAYTNDNGGAVKNEGNLTVNNCVFNHSTAFYQRGGAIYNTGSLNVTNTVFNDSYAYYGGSIYNDYGNLSLNNNTFSLNHVVGSGGAIYNDNYETGTTIYITGNKFHENKGEFNGGGVLFNNGTTIFNNNYINASYGLNGGSIYNLANITLDSNTFTGNSAYHASVLYNWGNALVENNIMQNNKVENKGGTLYNMNNMTVINNTILNNSAPTASAIYNALGYMEIKNNTIQNNRADNSATIYNQAKMTIINNRITDNMAQKGNNIYNAYKTIRHTNEDYTEKITMYFTGNLTLNNNILSNNTPLSNNSTASEIYNQGQILIDNNTFTHTSDNTRYLLYNHNLNTTRSVTGGLMILNNNTIQSTNKLVINNGNLTVNNTDITDSKEGIIDNYNNMELYNNRIINNTVKTDDNYIINTYNRRTVNIINNTFINNTNNKDDILFNNITLITSIKNNTYIGNYLKIMYEPVTVNDTIYNTINHEIKFKFANDVYDGKINSGNVNIYINNQYYNTFPVKNSTANITIKIRDINDKCNIKYTFLSTDNTFQPPEPIEYNITVIKQKTEINMNLDSEITPNYPLTIEVTSADNKKPNGTVIIYFNNEKMELPVTNGVVTYNYIPKTAGKTTVKATYTDEEGIYLNSTVTKTTTVIKSDTILTVNPLTGSTGEPVNISIELKDRNNNYLNGSILIKNSNNITSGIVNIINGKGRFSKIFRSAFNDNLTFIYEGSPIYNPVNTTINVNIHKIVTKVTSIPVNAQINDIISLKAMVKDEEGNSVTAGKVVFKVNGKTLRDDYGNIIYAAVINGTATAENYTVPVNWYTSKAKISVLYGGTNKYEAYRSENVTANITKRSATMKITPDTTTAKHGETVRLTVKITDNNMAVNRDHVIFKGGGRFGSRSYYERVNRDHVIFKVNGKTVKDNNGNTLHYNVTNGTVTINYTIPAGTNHENYTFTCVYGNRFYERCDTNSTIIIVKD